MDKFDVYRHLWNIKHHISKGEYETAIRYIDSVMPDIKSEPDELTMLIEELELIEIAKQAGMATSENLKTEKRIRNRLNQIVIENK